MDKLDTMPQKWPDSVTSTARAQIDLGCPGVATFEVLVATTSPTVKAYAAGASGTWEPVRYYVRKADGTETSVDADTSSAVLVAGDKIVVPLVGELKASILATAGSLTCYIVGDSTPGAIVWAVLKLIDGGVTATITDGTTVRGQLREVDVTITPYSAAASADDDLLADAQIVAACVRANDAKGWLVGFRFLDEDDQTPFDFDLLLLSASTTLGTEGSAVNLTDALSRNILGIVRVLQSANPSCDLGGNTAVYIGPNHKDMPVPISPATGTDDIYVALILRSGTPTFTASGIRIRMMFMDAV